MMFAAYNKQTKQIAYLTQDFQEILKLKHSALGLVQVSDTAKVGDTVDVPVSSNAANSGDRFFDHRSGMVLEIIQKEYSGVWLKQVHPEVKQPSIMCVQHIQDFPKVFP